VSGDAARLAFVAPFGLRAKGTTRARALPLARTLAKHGYETALFIPPYDSPEDSGRRWVEDGVDITNVALPDAGNRSRALWHLRLAWRLLAAVRRWNPDLVHIFKPKGPSGLVATALWWLGAWARISKRNAANQRGLCAVVVDSDDWEGPGGWNDDPRASYSSAERAFFSWQERHGLSHADAWTVASSCLRSRAISFGADPARVFILPNGISDTFRFFSTFAGSKTLDNDSRLSKVSRTPSVLLYTRFAGVRPEDVLQLWAGVRAILPGARLAVVGRGLMAEEESLRGAPGIDVLGWIEPAELEAVFAQADLAIVPWAETPSNRARNSVKVLELMALGVPIVAYAVGELSSTLDGVGMLVPPGDEAGMVSGIVNLLGDRARARSLGEAARERVRNSYTWEGLAEITIAAYRSAGVRFDRNWNGRGEAA
jgi:glycosyltransferase involved in cell wall biosynthesis